MNFKKDAEIKLYKDEEEIVDELNKTASSKRYGIDDFIFDVDYIILEEKNDVHQKDE